MLNQALGDFEYIQRKNNNEIILNTSYGNANITIYSPEVIRISISLNKVFDDFNYAVIQKPGAVEFELDEVEDKLIISTQSTILEIAKFPVRFTFKDINGSILNQDEVFGTSWIGDQVTTYKCLQKEEKFIGLGEKTGHLNRFGKGYQNWNTDYFGYDKDSDPLYVSIPFYIGIHPGGAYGIYLNNSYKTHFNFGASNNRFSSFSADHGLMDYYFIGGGSVSKIISNYTELTGRMPMPPKWSLGYQQCRYSYYPESEAISVATTFRDKDIPADAIVLDIHYMDDFKIFSWDSERFPGPKNLINSLKEKGFNTVLMCDPGIKAEEGYKPYEDGLKEDIFLKYPDGKPYQGEVWPGWCNFPDFTDPKCREWWGSQLKQYTDLGVNGYWNDMNEIATWGQMLPELIEFDFDGHKATTRKGRNIYGFQMARSTYEGIRKNLQKRPFNLTRAGFSGVQRFAAVWTGDNTASDEHMLLGVRMVNSLGLSGVPFTGYDVGGFIDNADEKLFARWIAIGAFSPFFRGHSMINSRDSEPWAYGEEVEEISRNYIKLRYRLLPYIYSIFYKATNDGLPIARSLAIDYATDDKIYKKEFENQYLFGPSLLIAPVESQKEIMKVYLPKGEWYDLYTDEKYQGGQEIFAECPMEKLPVFVKSSSIITMQESGINTAHKSEVLEVHVYPGQEENNFELYEDDGISFEHEQDGYYKRRIIYKPGDHLIFNTAEGAYSPDWKSIKIYIHASDINNVKVNDVNVDVKTEQYRFILPISHFDPIERPKEDTLKIENIAYIEVPISNNKININW
ncbi:MAG: glycoside hydrolase family 31 protein [Candidatus Cyclobacteriaceae bacterium M2_1C_046]